MEKKQVLSVRPANKRYEPMKLGYCPKCKKKVNDVENKKICKCGQQLKW